MKNLDIISKVKEYTIEECNEQDKTLIQQAKEAALRAYSPYSEYKVGAAVLLNNGTVVTGNNQENAAYPSGLCAERTALFYANSQYPDVGVNTVVVVAYTKGDFTEYICTPCGSCRQVFVEIEMRYNNPIRILMCGKDKVCEVDSIKALLPLSFDKDFLG